MPDRSTGRRAGALSAPILAAMALAATLAGCAWDPTTHSYVACCAAPPPGAPPPGAYQQGQQPGYGGPEAGPPAGYGGEYGGGYGGGYGAPGAAPPPHAGAQRGGGMMARFEAANVTHDGRLTLAQAEAAGWQRIARNFYAIDVQRKGYVTPQEIRAWNRAQRAARQGGQPMPQQPEY